MDYKICNSDELPNNSMKVINVRGFDILVCRSNERLFALDNCCPHRGASLSKSDIKGTKIICYMHDFEFDLNNGKLVHIPNKWKDQDSYSKIVIGLQRILTKYDDLQTMLTFCKDLVTLTKAMPQS